MRSPFARVVVSLVASLVFGVGASAQSLDWLPPGVLPPAPAEGPALCPGGFLQPEQGRAVLEAALAEFSTREKWQAYADHVRAKIQEGAQLSPWPRKVPLRPIARERRVHDGYSVEAIAIETVPGFFATGSLYRPLKATPPYAAVLTPHGHTRKIEKPEDYDTHGRFSPSVQTRAALLARMGAVVFTIDSFGTDDSIVIVGQEAHRAPFTLTLQVWNAIRAVDFLLSLEGVDPKRVAVTGESGGATQGLLLTALDPRVAVSVPVVMVSSYFFGGCPCESGQPVHRSATHFANNAMIAALAAPRPMLVVSDGKDWTRHNPEIEAPFLRKIYALQGADEAFSHVHLPTEGHDYGASKRAAMVRFLAQQLGLDFSAVKKPGGDGAIDESTITIEPAAKMHVFDDAHPLPPHALRSAAEIEQALKDLQR